MGYANAPLVGTFRVDMELEDLEKVGEATKDFHSTLIKSAARRRNVQYRVLFNFFPEEFAQIEDDIKDHVQAKMKTDFIDRFERYVKKNSPDHTGATVMSTNNRSSDRRIMDVVKDGTQIRVSVSQAPENYERGPKSYDGDPSPYAKDVHDNGWNTATGLPEWMKTSVRSYEIQFISSVSRYIRGAL